ncbi:unnamed protein product [Hermetia illucens]|nr:unnamed protein product [Hermetia illucens]
MLSIFPPEKGCEPDPNDLFHHLYDVVLTLTRSDYGEKEISFSVPDYNIIIEELLTATASSATASFGLNNIISTLLDLKLGTLP